MSVYAVANGYNYVEEIPRNDLLEKVWKEIKELRKAPFQNF